MFVGYFVHNHTIMIFCHGSRLRASAPCSCHPYTKYHRARLQADGSNHMNKEHWVSVVLAGPVTPSEIHELLAESHELTSE